VSSFAPNANAKALFRRGGLLLDILHKPFFDTSLYKLNNDYLEKEKSGVLSDKRPRAESHVHVVCAQASLPPLDHHVCCTTARRTC